MTAKDVILNSMQSSEMVINAYLGDLEDKELLIRAEPGMNHIAWQLGHLIGSEKHFMDIVKPGSSPALPEDFEAGHGREQTKEDDPAKYYSKARYQELWKAQREATKAVLESLSDEDLGRSGPEFPPFAPSVGALMNMCGLHPLMHAGQFVAVRRKLGKPVSI
jgi:hypothetical protein